MKTTPITVRVAQSIDAHQINEIYNWYVANSVATFGEKTTIEERKKWLEQFNMGTSTRLFVAQVDGAVVGYACSFRYRDGGVFKNTIETSVYVHPQFGGIGVGSQLYTVLLGALAEGEFHRVVVGIALPNDACIALHEKFGFEKVGVFDEYAHYKGQFISSLWMQKKLILPTNA